METKQIVVYPNDILTTPTKKTDLKTIPKSGRNVYDIKKRRWIRFIVNQIGEDKSVCVIDVIILFSY